MAGALPRGLPLCTIGIGIFWAGIVLLHYTTTLIPASLYGLHYKKLTPLFQVASAPLFLHNAGRWTYVILAGMVQACTMLSPLNYAKTTGEVTQVIYSWPGLLRTLHSLALLLCLETVYKQNSGGSWRFFKGLLTLSLLTYVLRSCLGLGSYHTGRDFFPVLFFSDAMREVSQGLLPALLAFYLILLGRDAADCQLKIGPNRSVGVMTIASGLLLVPIGFTLYWNMTGLAIGVLVALLGSRSVAYLPTSVNELEATSKLASPAYSVMKRGALLAGLHFLLYFARLPSKVRSSGEIAHIGDPNEPLLTLLLMTAPRPMDAPHVLQTIESYLDAFPKDATDPL